MNDEQYEALKSKLLGCLAVTGDELENLYAEAKARDDLQVWPFLEYYLGKRTASA